MKIYELYKWEDRSTGPDWTSDYHIVETPIGLYFSAEEAKAAWVKYSCNTPEMLKHKYGIREREVTAPIDTQP